MKHRWTDEEVVVWAEAYSRVEGHITLMTLEKELGVPHATIWWCFTRRLPKINKELYHEVLISLNVGRSMRGKRREH